MKLQVGKTYLDGTNHEVKIISYQYDQDLDGFYYEGSNGHFYFEDGSYSLDIPKYNLIKEVDVVGAMLSMDMVEFKINNGILYQSLRAFINKCPNKDSNVDASLENIRNELIKIEKAAPELLGEKPQTKEFKEMSAKIIQLVGNREYQPQQMQG